MKKRIWTSIAALTLTASLISGCGSSSATSESSSSAGSGEETIQIAVA